jgi:hypothetical protein
MLDKIQYYWDKVQDLFDVSGDMWMGLFTAFILVRIIAVLTRHAPPLTSAEAATYSSAVAAFAYSNKGGKPS